MARQGYAKLSNGLWLNDKVNDLIERSPRAFAMWTLAISYCSDQLNDGIMSMRAWRRIGADDEDVLTLVAAGLVDRTDDGMYAIHDYLQHQNSRESVESEREAAKERMSRKRASKRSPEQNEPTTEQDETRSDEVRANTDRTATERSDEVRTKFLGLNQNQNQNQNQILPPPTPSAEGATADGETDDEGFKRFEAAYPKHGNRARTLDAYAKALVDGAMPSQLEAAARAYAKACRDENKPTRFIPQPANWLTNGQWRDHLPAPARPELPSDAWIGRHLLEKLPDWSDGWHAQRRLIRLIRDGTPADQAAETIIGEITSKREEPTT
ncbi:hypothetical protein BW13_00815 [Bifidobacterium sp. UTCIF-37]|uniref:hypothetical protein n=1 Tax=unclassified Bifidobacterium TaxID=2608897 RepID=UPI0011266F1E|nr:MULTISPECIES: hypothetical protein [unclassified Bifidobacterium]TPF87426.1 hypothetical protein BW13_00815 [Bifidobacterium sp. UTCIF-37]TPF91202.1 hypothetical protein BW11_00815 [Bifidobacterium sp. UTCIF-38]